MLKGGKPKLIPKLKNSMKKMIITVLNNKARYSSEKFHLRYERHPKHELTLLCLLSYYHLQDSN